MTPGQGIADFWKWWPEAEAKIEATFKAGLAPEIRDQLNAKVHAIHPELVWSIRSSLSGFVFVLSGEGNFLLRALTEIWRRASPTTASSWRFLPHRTATTFEADRVLHHGGMSLPVRQVGIAIQEDTIRARVNIGVHHPGFRSLSSELRPRAARLLIELALGEDEVERWVGDVEPLLNSPGRPLRLEDLGHHLARIAAKSQERPFAMIQGRTESGQVMVAMLALSLKRIDHLAHDHHLEVTLPLLNARSNGLPNDAELPVIRAMEDELVDAMRGVDEVFYGHLIVGGTVRILFYVHDLVRADGALKVWLQRHSERAISVQWSEDPTWESFRRF